MKPIGGFLELELPNSNRTIYHQKALALSTARACLKVALQQIKPKKVYVPYYTCDALFEPLIELQIDYEYYSLSQDLSPKFLSLQEDEYLIFVNYFGLCKKHVQSLLDKYPRKVIVDNTQAFFEQAYPDTWSFNSARKFFGVPDGGYLYAPINLTEHLQQNDEFHFAHLINRFIGKQQQAYSEFVTYEKSLKSEVLGISRLSEHLLSLVDYNNVATIRRNNYSYFSRRFDAVNKLRLTWDGVSVPFVYPLLLRHPVRKESLFEQNIFVPTYWPDTLRRGVKGFELEEQLTLCLLPLPIDHRYNLEDCKRVSDAVQALIEYDNSYDRA